MKIVIHKGTNEIGGNCIEIATDETAILIDYGTPLQELQRQVTVPEHIDAVLISHAHLDHFGEITRLDDKMPIYCGLLTLDLINSMKIFSGNKLLTNHFKHFEAWKSFQIGDLSITPYLVDHSATDAYAFLIETKSEKILYSGDFRGNGRKAKLFDNMLTNSHLHNVDVLLMEGTMIKRSNGQFPDEQSVEEEIYKTMSATPQITFMISSSQNIDTLVSAYKASKRLGKILVVDIYTAWILEKVKTVANVMNLDFIDVKVYKPTQATGGSQYGKVKKNHNYFKAYDRKIFSEKNSITIEEMRQEPAKYFVKCSPWYIENILKVLKQEKANIIYSQWLGYLEDEFSEPRTVALYKRLKETYNWVYAHTSGHADLKRLTEFTQALQPKNIIPIHTQHKEEFKDHFKNVVILDDHEVYDVGGQYA